MYSERCRTCRRRCSSTRSPTQLSVALRRRRCRETRPSGWEPLLVMLAVVTAVALAGAYALLSSGTSEPRPLRRRQYPARYGTAAPAWCGGPSRSSRPCASAAGRPRRRTRARPPRAAPRAGSPGRSRGSGSACPARSRPPTCRTIHSSPCQLSRALQPPYRSPASSGLARLGLLAASGAVAARGHGTPHGAVREHGLCPAYA